MRRLTLLLLLVVVAAVGAGPATAANPQIAIKANGFSPSFQNLNVGDTVTWLNADKTNRQVVADDASFASGILRPGQSYSHTFLTAARIGYHDGLDKRLKATVNVKVVPIPDAITIALSQPYIHYGEEVHLIGAVSSKKAGESVAVYAQPYGQSSFVQLATVTTTDAGNWDYLTKPELLTNYQAKFRTATSAAVMVQVQPKITFLISQGLFTAHVLGTHSFGNRFLYVQQKSSLGQWVSLKRVLLNEDSSVSFKVTLKTKVPHPLRVFMTVNQAGTGYLASWSGTQVVVRRCPGRVAAC